MNNDFISVREVNEKELRKEFDDRVKGLFQEFEAMCENVPHYIPSASEQDRTNYKILSLLFTQIKMNENLIIKISHAISDEPCEKLAEQLQEEIDYIYAALHYYNKQHCKLLKLTKKLFSFTSLGKKLYEK